MRLRPLLPAILVGVALGALPCRGQAQDSEELFRKVSPAVLVIRAKGRAVGSRGIVTFNEIGSGVLISATARS